MMPLAPSPSTPDPESPTTKLAAAFTQIASAFEGLAATWGIDPMEMLMTMMSARTGAASRPAPRPPLVGVPTDAELVQRSHDLVDAMDRGDLVAVAAALAPGFVRFVEGIASDREATVMTIMQRREKLPPAAERTWDTDCVFRKGDALVFTGRSHEIQGGNETKGGYLLDGWYLLQWVPVGDAWRVQLLTWHAEPSEREHFNEIFHKGRGFSLEPNRLLVDTIRAGWPGTALDVAMGQGRNALYLASQGWKVTGVDGSDEALRIARETAAERNLPLDTVRANIDEWDFGVDRFDLVTLFYAGDHARWIEKIQASLRTGGLFVVEGWAKETADSPYGFGEGQLAKLFDGYEIVRDEVVQDVPDWKWDTGTLVRFVARKR